LALKDKVACVVLAAGMSRRFGSPKQLAKLGKSGQSLLQTAIDVANQSKASYVLLVLGFDASEIAAELKLGRAQVVLNKDFESGLSSSVRTGVANLPEDCAAAVFMVADQPNLTSDILNRLIEKFQSQTRDPKNLSQIFAVAHRGEPKNPVLIKSELFPMLAELKGDVGARELIRRLSGKVSLVEVDDEMVFADIDVPP
jgi:molybdenum cofactor cytidylyltransferase